MTGDFERALRAHGAVVEPFQGIVLPVHFGDVGREWRAASGGAAVYAAGFRSLIAATGEDRVTFLHGMLSNDIKSVAVGQGVYAAFLTQQGKVVSDLRVYVRPDRLLLDVVAWRRAPLQEALERFIVADDIELIAADAQPLIGLEGPLALAMAAEALGVDELTRQRFAQTTVAFESAEVLAVTVSEIDRSGVLLCGPEQVAPALFDACVEAGARPLGMRALDVLRVESGVPWAGIDMDETTLIMEAGREAAISFTKGCYLGQEVVERIAARGHVNRLLVGVRIETDAPPSAGTRLLAAGQEVGTITSAVRSEASGTPAGLAIVQRKHAAPGERLALDSGATAIVSALPFDVSASSQ